MNFLDADVNIIGCSIHKSTKPDETTPYMVVCLLNGSPQTNLKTSYRAGLLCSECDKYGETCDNNSEYKGLCTTLPIKLSETCQPGEKGDTGDIGVPGRNGENGKDGLPGLPGPLGFTGLAGFPGLVGPPGISGKRGITGATGPKGVKGNTGDRGLPGLNGRRGMGCDCRSIEDMYRNGGNINPSSNKTWNYPTSFWALYSITFIGMLFSFALSLEILRNGNKRFYSASSK